MLISVVIPTHYRSELLNRAIKSAIEQTYKNIEIIVVSDGDDKYTNDLMKQYESCDMIKFYKINPSRGANFARNYGINKASGKIIAFLDDDDEWYPDKLESQYKIIENNLNIGLVYTGIKIMYIRENTSYSYLGLQEGDLSKEILKGNIIGTTSSVLVSKELLKEVGCFDEHLPAMQDYDLWIRLCQITKVGVVAKEKVNYYNYTDKKQISLNTKKYIEAGNVILEKYEHLFRKLNKKELRTKKSRRFMGIAKRALRNNEKKLALKYTLNAITTMPSLKNLSHIFIVFLPYKYLLKVRNFKN